MGSSARSGSGVRWLWGAVVWVLVVLLLSEGAARLFWLTRGVSFWRAPSRLHHAFYPELAPVEALRIARGGDPVELLLLGGSVLTLEHGSVPHRLRERLTQRSGRHVRIHNLAKPAHTSLDSWYKYRHLADARFDLVVVYHGINEVRANNSPADVFRSDYSHYHWYRLVNALERRPRRWLTLPYTLVYARLLGSEALGLVELVPKHTHRPGWLEHGCEVKTEEAFRSHLQRIVDLAGERGDPLLLSTFAYHLDPEYTNRQFLEKRLDYATHALPVEVWGRPQCVAAALDAHNRVVRELAARNPRVILADAARLVPGGAAHFNDLCHLTLEGSRRLGDLLADAAARVF